MISNDGKNLVFLLSMPRSGSTILSLLLGSHSLMHCPPEPWFLLKLSVLEQPSHIDNAFDDRLATMGTREFLHSDIFIRAARVFATTAYNDHLSAADKNIFIDKTPRYYHILPLIDRLFPRARKIWLKRNPLDVALSYKTTWDLDIKEIVGEKLTENSFDFSLGLYSLETYFKDNSPLKYEVQYEELVQSPVQILTGICDFLDVQFEQEIFDYAQNTEFVSQHKSTKLGDKKVLGTSKVHTRSVGKWANDLSPAEIQQIVNLLGIDIFRRMGYGDIVTMLRSLGIEACSEIEAADARYRINSARIDKLKQLNCELDRITNTWSWKITEPLRLAGKAVGWRHIKKSLKKVFLHFQVVQIVLNRLVVIG